MLCMIRICCNVFSTWREQEKPFSLENYVIYLVIEFYVEDHFVYQCGIMSMYRMKEVEFCWKWDSSFGETACDYCFSLR